MNTVHKWHYLCRVTREGGREVYPILSGVTSFGVTCDYGVVIPIEAITMGIVVVVSGLL